MRVVIAIITLGLASPAVASEKCDLFEDVVKKVCITSFRIALGRDLGSFTGKRQEEENNYVYLTCNGAATITKDNCDAGKFNNRSVGSCTHVANVAHGSVETACTINGRPEMVKSFDGIFTVLGRNQRAAICKKAVAQVRPVAQDACP
jgi:hypothetical protein